MKSARLGNGRGITRYQQLYEVLSQNLRDGVFAECLPSEPALREIYGVSRTTVRGALALLEKEGRIVRRRGSGTYPAPGASQASQTLGMSVLLYEKGDSGGAISHTRVHDGKGVAAQAATAIPAELGRDVIRVDQHRAIGRRPYAVSAIYIPRAVINGHRRLFLDKSKLQNDLEKIVADVTSFDRTITAVAADAVGAKHLRVSIGTPLLRVRSALRDGEGRLIAFDESLLRPGSSHLSDNMNLIPSKGTGARWTLAEGV